MYSWNTITRELQAALAKLQWRFLVGIAWTAILIFSLSQILYVIQKIVGAWDHGALIEFLCFCFIATIAGFSLVRQYRPKHLPPAPLLLEMPKIPAPELDFASLRTSLIFGMIEGFYESRQREKLKFMGSKQGF